MKIESNFNTEMELYWEQAFNKFGFGDGLFCQTGMVIDALEDEGYEVDYTSMSIHNEVITSIKEKESGQELMPCEKDNPYRIGYDDPRDYLPAFLIQILDEQFYGKTTPFCPNCGCEDGRLVWRNGSDEVQCDNCGHSETE